MKEALIKEVVKVMDETAFTSTLFINGIKIADNYISNERIVKALEFALDEKDTFTIALMNDDGKVVFEWKNEAYLVSYLYESLPDDKELVLKFRNTFTTFGNKKEIIEVADIFFKGEEKGFIEIKSIANGTCYLKMNIL